MKLAYCVCLGNKKITEGKCFTALFNTTPVINKIIPISAFFDRKQKMRQQHVLCSENYRDILLQIFQPNFKTNHNTNLLM